MPSLSSMHALVVEFYCFSLRLRLYLTIIITAISAVRSQGSSIYAVYCMSYWAVWIEIIISTCRWPIIVLETIFSRFVMIHAQFFSVFVISFSLRAIRCWHWFRTGIFTHTHSNHCCIHSMRSCIAQSVPFSSHLATHWFLNQSVMHEIDSFHSQFDFIRLTVFD